MKLTQPEAQTLHRLFGLEPRHLEQVMAVGLNGRKEQGAFCEVYLESGTAEGLSWDQGRLMGSGSEDVLGGGVRVLMADKIGYAHTDKAFSIRRLKAAAREARQAAEFATVASPIDIEGQKQPHHLYGLDASNLLIGQKARQDLLAMIDKEARARDKRIKNVSVGLTIEEKTVIICNSLDHFLVDVRPLIRLNVSCLAEQNGRVERGSLGGGGRVDFDFFYRNELWRTLMNTAVDEAITNLSAVAAPVGEMSVVLAPGWPGVLIHEAVGHGLEGDFNRRRTSAFSGRIGEKVAADCCTIIDDGTMPNRRGSLDIDDEGEPTGRTVLIENGILKGYLQDRQNAALMRTARTGNGRRESYKFAPMPRMTNTYMAGGQYDPKEIIGSVKRGIFAVSFGGGQVDITSGAFTFSATSARLIENGELTVPLKGVTFIGNGPKALHFVSMVGNDVALDTGVGTCGKDGQGVPVGVGMPTVRIDRMTVGGTGA
jgi:TldD protein